jgi:hypothetical protein
VLRRLLDRRGIASYFPDEISLPGRTTAEALQEAMAGADLVVLVLDAHENNSNVLLELGVALGMGKRLLLLAPSAVVAPGMLLTGIPVIRGNPTETEKIEFGLDQVLAAPAKAAGAGNRPEKQTRPLGEKADLLVEQWRSDPASPAERLEHVVLQALTDSGITSHAWGVRGDGGADLAVWSDDFEPWVSNPLLIRIASGRLSADEFRGAVAHLARALDATGSLWGLLIYEQTLADSARQALQGSFVLALSVEDLLRSLKSQALGDIVRRLRTDRVHGGT